jgi:hypothetical protein
VKDPALNTRGIGDPSLGLLSGLAPALADTVVTVATDIALVVDLDGTIRSVAVGADSPTPNATSWIGRPWADTVTAQTRRKIERLLHEVAVSGVSRRSEVDHLLPSGAVVPVAYSAVRLGSSGPVLAAGRDLRAVAAIQQRFVRAQQQMERDHWRRREVESRCRRAFHAWPDPVLLIDAGTLSVVEANPAAARRLGLASDAPAGRDGLAGLDAAARAAVVEACARARTGGRPVRVRPAVAGAARGPGPSDAVEAVVAPLPDGGADLLLLRWLPGVPDDASVEETEEADQAGGRGAEPVRPGAALADGASAQRVRRDARALLARVGQLPLPELMRQAGALAERRFLERALELSGGDRDAAARLLSLERAPLDARLDALAAGPGADRLPDGAPVG